MRKTILALTAASLAIPTVALPSAANAHTYRGRSYNSTYCRRSGGTTGAIVGGVGGAVAGNVIAGGTVGTLVGAGAGALLGRHIERNTNRANCYKRRYYR
ncbi:MAG: glycine zipper 2TM domain-containing protein [Sphingomicrobium sp.]